MNEPIQDKAPKPAGLLPKHIQSWLILGLAVLMIVIMWLTGGKKQQTAPKANAPVAQQPLPVEVNETKIADLQNRIQELQREQLAAQSALAQQNRFATESIFERAQSGLGLRAGGRNHVRFGTMARFDFEAHSSRAKFFNLAANKFDDAFRLLIRNKAGRDFCAGPGGHDGFAPFTLVTAGEAIDFQSRAGGPLFVRSKAAFPK